MQNWHLIQQQTLLKVTRKYFWARGQSMNILTTLLSGNTLRLVVTSLPLPWLPQQFTKRTPQILAFSIIRKTKSVTYLFYCIFGKLPKLFNFYDGMVKSYSVERKSHFMKYKKFHWITFFQKLLFESAHLVIHACKKSGWVTEQNFKIKQMFRASFISGFPDYTCHLTSDILRAWLINRNLDSLSWRVRSCYVVCRLPTRTR